jgi:hypothetical protein
LWEVFAGGIGKGPSSEIEIYFGATMWLRRSWENNSMFQTTHNAERGNTFYRISK